MRLTGKFFIIALLMILTVGNAWAEEENKSKVVEAADNVIKGLPDTLKAGINFSKMTPEERVNWVLNSVEEKVKSTVTEKFQDAMKEKMENYAKEAIRAKAFMEIGIPKIKHAYAMGESFNWSMLDAEIASKADTNLNRLNAGIKAAQITWATVQSYRQGDFSAAARTLGGEIGELLAEAYIPGYGYLKVGAAMVELLGNYVLDYATDTAVEGMLNDMYGMKSNPQGLAKWLIDKSPSDIERDLNDKFNDGMGFGYVYRGQGTDKGEDAIKSRLQSELIALRSSLVSQMKEQERREKQAQQEIEQYLQKYKEAEKALRAEAEKVKAEADAQLAPINAFKIQVNGFRKQDVQETIAEIQAQESEIGSGEGVAYTPLNAGSLISELETVYSEIKDTPNGYDYQAVTRMRSAYLKRRAESIKNVSEANKESCRLAMKQVDDQYQPRLNSLYSQYKAAKDGRTKESLYAQYEAARNEYSAAQMRRGAACTANGKRLGLEVETFKQEEEIVHLNAQERASKLSASIRQGIEKIIDGIKQVNSDYNNAKKTWIEEVQQTLAYPSFFLNPGAYDQSLGSGVAGSAANVKSGRLQVYQPGELHGSRERAIEAIEKIKKDQTLISSFSAKEKEVLVKYQAEILRLKSEFESLVPENLRGAGNSRTPEQDSYIAEEDQRVAKYGSSAASYEQWPITHPPLVRFEALPEIPPVPNTRYFEKQLAELGTVAQARVEKFKAAQKDWEEELQEIDFYADLDRIAVSIISLDKNINSVLGRFLGAYPNFRMKDGKESLHVKAEESDGAKMLKEMKEAWEKAEPYVEKMRKNVTAYGKGIKYISSSSNPNDALKRLPYYEGVPALIDAHEKRMAEGEQQRLDSLKMVEDELAKLAADIESLKDPEKIAFYNSTIKQLRAMFNQIFNIIKVDRTRSEFKKEYEALRADMEAYAVEHEKMVKARQKEYQRQLEAEAAAKAAAEKQKWQQENDRLVRESNPLLYYGYEIIDPRINTFPVKDADGDVIITKDKLEQGQINLTARLNHIDHAKTLLISEDGRTWKELPVSQNINYSFMPFPQKRYQFFIKIKTDDMLEASMNFLPNGGYVIYKDTDFEQEVVQMVRSFAEAYERKDISAFSSMISRDFLGDKTALELGAQLDFDLFTDIRLKIYINRIYPNNGLYITETKWDKSQYVRETGQEQKTTGRTTFVFTMEDGYLRLYNMRGNLMVATLSPDIALASGLNQTVVDQIITARDERNPTQPGAGTIIDAGGVESSGSSGNLLSYSGRVVINTEGYSFATDSQVPFNGDIDLLNDELGANEIQLIPGATQLSDVTTAPELGYANMVFGVSVGDVYVVHTLDDHYVKLKVTALNVGVNMTFDYAYQQTAGSRDLSE